MKKWKVGYKLIIVLRTRSKIRKKGKKTECALHKLFQTEDQFSELSKDFTNLKFTSIQPRIPISESKNKTKNRRKISHKL